MDDARTLSAFFGLWAEAEPGARLDGLKRIVHEGFVYADPQAPEPVRGAEAMSAFLAAFTANMPDARAQVVAPVDVQHGHARATVRFERDGTVFATGQYFAAFAPDGRLATMVGFMGRGPE
ncbi:MAG: nuclear transport factor 2 family protein [Pseudomonadota bacterium]